MKTWFSLFEVFGKARLYITAALQLPHHSRLPLLLLSPLLFFRSFMKRDGLGSLLTLLK